MNNRVVLVGTIATELAYSHSNCYSTTVAVKRTSGTVDNIKVIIPDNLIKSGDYYIGKNIGIIGEFRSYKLNGKLLLFVFANSIETVERTDVNDIFLEGVICKPPIFRQTPLGRDICDVILSVKRGETADTLPCIAWRDTAEYISHLEVGSCLRVAGRIQSRTYGDDKTAYEISICLVESV